MDDAKVVEAVARALLKPYAERWDWPRYHGVNSWRQFAGEARIAIDAYQAAISPAEQVGTSRRRVN